MRVNLSRCRIRQLPTSVPLYTMKRLLQAYQCSDSDKGRRQLRDWLSQPLGQALQQREQEVVRQMLPGLFGYHLLQLGEGLDTGLLTESRIPHRMVLLEEPATAPQQYSGVEYLHGSASQLPLASDSLDMVILSHRMEFESHPHQVLREAERVLIPEGHLLITGFNPLSQFGLRRLLQGWRDEAPWSGHFYTPLRLKDWLSLLGFDTVLLRYFFYRPPLQHTVTMAQLGRMEEWGGRFCSPLGGAYLLLAKKRIATLTPIKPRWRTARRLINVGLTEPSARRDKQ